MTNTAAGTTKQEATVKAGPQVHNTLSLLTHKNELILQLHGECQTRLWQWGEAKNSGFNQSPKLSVLLGLAALSDFKTIPIQGNCLLKNFQRCFLLLNFLNVLQDHVSGFIHRCCWICLDQSNKDIHNFSFLLPTVVGPKYWPKMSNWRFLKGKWAILSQPSSHIFINLWRKEIY